jgi:hypothetical protein
LGSTLERAIWLGLCACLIGFIFIVVASNNDGAWSTVLANIGTALLTVGLVGITYDLFLRDRLLAEVLDVVGVKESVSSFGLREIRRSDAAKIGDLIGSASELCALPLDPILWIDRDFELICRRAKARPLALTLLLPANESPFINVLAERLGKTEREVEQILDQAARGELGDAWDASRPHIGSTLKIQRFGGLPATGFLRSEQLIALEIGPPIRYPRHNHEGFVVVTSRAHGPLDAWLEDQIRRESEDENLSQIDQRPLASAETKGTR